MRTLVFLILFVVSSVASAASPTTHWSWDGGETWYSSGSEACNAFKAAVYPSYPVEFVSNAPNQDTCNAYGNILTSLTRSNRCSGGTAPDYSQPPGSQCADATTTTTTTTSTTTTTTQQCPPAGEMKWSGTETYATAANMNTCIAGCAYQASGMMKTATKVILFGPFRSEGRTCNASDPGYGDDNDPGSRCSYRNAAGKCEAACRTGQEYKQVPTGAYACVNINNTSPTNEPKDTTCPRGYINISTDPNNPNCAPTGGLGNTSNSGPATCPPGQHSTSNGPNGASYCVYDTNDNNPAPKTSTESNTTRNNADGTTTNVKTISWNNSDGSTTTKTVETTTKPDGTKETKEGYQTTKNKQGTEGVNDGEDGKNDFCKQNPGLTICKNSTVSGRGASTTCTGDAIQCEILKRISDDTPTSWSILGNSLLSGNDPLSNTLPKPSNGVSLSLPGSLNQTGFLGAACFPDKQVTLGDFSVVIPFSQACNGLLALRSIIIVLAAFACLKILSSVIFK